MSPGCVPGIRGVCLPGRRDFVGRARRNTLSAFGMKPVLPIFRPFPGPSGPSGGRICRRRPIRYPE